MVAHGPTSCEGLDSRLLDVLRARRGPDAVPPLPRGGAWLFVELAGDEAGEVDGAGAAARGRRHRRDALVVTDPAAQARLWRIREDGAGLAGRAPSDKPAWPGWEDAAVPPQQPGRLPGPLRRARRLVRHDVRAVRPLRRRVHARAPRPAAGPARRHEDHARVPHRRGPARGRVRRFAVGRARRRPRPLGAAAAHVLPGRDRPVRRDQARLRPGQPAQPRRPGRPRPGRRRRPRPAGRFPLKQLAMAYPHDDGDLGQAVHRCTGVGKCRADNSAAGGVMCPSYLATREEKDSTRGPRPGAAGGRPRRARLVATRRCTTRWTSACPARAAPPTARPASTWPPTSPRCCTRPTGASCARARTTRSASCRSGPAWPDGPRGWPTSPSGCPCSAAFALWLAGVDKRRSVPGLRPPPVPPQLRARRRPTAANPSCCSPTRSPTPSHPRWPRPPYGCCAPPATSPGCRPARSAAA